MIGTSVRPEARSEIAAGSLLARPALLALGIGAILLLALGVTLLAVAAVIAGAPRGTVVGIADGATDQPLAAEIPVTLTGWQSRFEHAALYEAPIGPDGRPGAERPVVVQAQAVRESWWPEGSEFLVRPVSGELSADARYRLVVRTSALGAALPWPRPVTAEREVSFSTLRSPVPQAAGGAARLKWGQPLQIRWEAPVAEVRYEVIPSTPIRTAIDPSQRVSSVVLENPADGQTYRIAVTGARGANGIPLARSAEYTVVAPTRPTLQDVAEEPVTVELGKPLTLRWSVPVERLALETDPPLTTSWQVDRRDPTSVQVSLDGLAQGESYSLKIVEAVSRDGAPLVEPVALTLQTPERLLVDTLDTGVESGPVSVKAKPVLTFSQPIRDRRNATAALSVEPAIPGRWEWLDDSSVQFSPLRPFPYETEITVKVRPGLDGARAVNGAYFENEAILPFVTETDKLIDVDVTRQVMTLYQQGRVVRTFPVATGVPGADTPLGEFTVEYKMPVARFQGVNVNGSRYDIPDVHWVLAFMGDYTIHGAYWRSNFGAPGSNGCVSLTDEDAKAVFDWAPEGTRIRIHY